MPLTYRGRKIAVVGQPKFEKLEISPFGEKQISRFIDKYRAYLQTLKDNRSNIRIPSKDEFFQSQAIADIATRPIQLRMLFEVLPAYEGNLDELTVHELYGYFVDLLVHREAAKQPRRQLTENDRTQFLQALAFYMWYQGATTVTIEDIPDSCITISGNGTLAMDVLKRDLVNGSFLEVRYPGRLYFPHRSIQEYLVSEFILNFFREEINTHEFCNSINANIDFSFIDDRVSPEVLDFMRAASGRKEHEGAFKQLRNHKGLLSNKTLSYFLSSDTPPEYLLNAALDGDIWGMVLLIHGRRTRGWMQEAGDEDLIFKKILLVLDDLSKEIRERYFHQFVFLSWTMISINQKKNKAIGQLQELFLLILNYTITRSMGRGKRQITGRIRPSFVSSLLYWLPDPNSPPPKIIKASDIYRILAAKCEGIIGLSTWYGENFQLEEFSLLDIPCTPEMEHLFYETFDEEAFKPKKKKRRRKDG